MEECKRLCTRVQNHVWLAVSFTKNGCTASSLMCITDHLDGSCTGCTCQTLDKRTAS